MKRFIALLPLLLLAACAKTGPSQNVESLLDNPLFADYYASDIVNNFTQMIIQEDEVILDESKKAYLDAQRAHWMTVVDTAGDIENSNPSGSFIGIAQQAKGKVLRTDNKLHFGPNFDLAASPNIEVYITTAVDPRDVEFPDETAKLVGKLVIPYGAQSYDLPALNVDAAYNTVVLWEPGLALIYSFAQLR